MKTQKDRPKTKTFTLLEMLIAIATLAVFFSFIARTIYVFQKGLKENNAYFTVNENARRAIDCLNKDLRAATTLPSNTTLSSTSDIFNVETDSETISFEITSSGGIKTLTRQGQACASYINSIVVTTANNTITTTVNTAKNSIFGDQKTETLKAITYPRNI